MSLGDLVVSLSANTARFENDMGKAAQLLEKFGNQAKWSSAQSEKAIQLLSEHGVAAVDRLQRAFDKLDIKSSLQIEKEQIQAVLAFEKIKESGVASAKEIERAYNSARKQLNLSTTDEINKLRAAAVNAEIKQILELEQATIKKAAVAEKAAADEIVAINKLRAAAVNAEIAKQLAIEKTKIAEEERSAQSEKAIQLLSEHGVAAVDRLQRAFDKLDIKSGIQLEKEKVQVQLAFEKIKESGVASAKEIERAHTAMRQKLDLLDGKSNPATSHTNSINLLSLASVAAIAKVQILYSLVNQLMSVIGSMPRVAVDAIETFQASIVKNAAVITSMSGDIKNIGLSYQENKRYAEAVQTVLVKMDAQTIASYKQLQLMNDAFVNQGIFIDINNKKQLEGYKNIANALATISAGMANPDLQFSQEIRGLINAEDKPTNMLFRQLKAIDPLLKEHLASWKKIAAETGNAGYVLEKLGPLLVGYAAASGDIDSLWATVKSTLATIRDEVLRGGLSQGFSEIVTQMKELAKYANENKEKIQAFLREGFADAKQVASFIWEWRDAFIALGKASLFLAITSGISSVIEKIKVLDATFKAGALYKVISNPAMAAILIGAYGGSKIVSRASEIESYKANAVIANKIYKNQTGNVFNNIPGFDAAHYEEFQKSFPLDGPELLALSRTKGAASLKADQYGTYKLILDLEKIKKLKESIDEIKVPKAAKGSTEVDEKTINLQNAYNKTLRDQERELALANPYLDEHSKQIIKIEEKYADLMEQFAKVPGAVNRLKALRDALLAINDEEYNRKMSLEQNENLSNEIGAATSKIEFNRSNVLQFQLKKPVYSLMGKEQNTGYSNEIALTMAQQEKLLRLEEKFNKDRLAMQVSYDKEKTDMMMDQASQSLSIAKNAFADNMALQILFMVAEKAMAVTRIMINAAASEAQITASTAAAIAGLYAAYSAIPGGVAIAGAQAATLQAMSAAQIASVQSMAGVSIGLVLASGAIEGMNIAGGRALGGPVVAGQTYLVNENRKTEGPEYFTPGVSGVITPASKMNNSTYAPTFNIDARNSTLSNSEIKGIIDKAVETSKAAILNSMNRGGEFALASGRMR